MAVYPIRVFPDPVLTMPASEVTEFDDALGRLAADMFETMYEAPGVGLSAPQIGISKRVFVADVGEGPFAMVNPEIVEVSRKSSVEEEGCLSLPGRYWKIKRPDYAVAAGFDLEGNPTTFEGGELMGRVLQHEIDHLNGVLLLEHLSARARRAALSELRSEALAGDQPHPGRFDGR